MSIITRAYEWIKHKLVEAREPLPMITLEPEPENNQSEDDFSDLKQSFDSLLSDLTKQEAEIQADITFYETKAGLTMPDRRHLKHLHEELHGLKMDILAIELNRDKTFK
jgi:hypothetical protein